MPKTYFITGLPWVGKSTRAQSIIRQYLVGNKKFCYANRDTIRYQRPDYNEPAVSDRFYVNLKHAINNRYDVILDNTYQTRRIQDTDEYKMLTKAKYDIEHIDMNIDNKLENIDPLQIARMHRSDYIPDPVLNSMWFKYLSLNKKNFQETHPHLAEPLKGKKVCIVDLDGTLFDTREKFSHVNQYTGRPDWKYIFSPEGILTDKFRQEVADMIDPDATVIIVSGRPDSHEVWFSTQKLLRENNFRYDYVLRRSRNSNIPDHVIKENILKLLIDNGLDVSNTLVLDDRKSVINMRESNGLKVINCSLLEDNDF